MKYFKLRKFVGNIFDRLFFDEEDQYFLDNVPPFCRQCELLGICRDSDNNWKCHHGCIILNNERRDREKK